MRSYPHTGHISLTLPLPYLYGNVESMCHSDPTSFAYEFKFHYVNRTRGTILWYFMLSLCINWDYYCYNKLQINFRGNVHEKPIKSIINNYWLIVFTLKIKILIHLPVFILLILVWPRCSCFVIFMRSNWMSLLGFL